MGLAPVSMLLSPSNQQSVSVLCCLGLADGSLKDSTEMGWQESLGQPVDTGMGECRVSLGPEQGSCGGQLGGLGVYLISTAGRPWLG